jgi:hypothetical protein
LCGWPCACEWCCADIPVLFVSWGLCLPCSFTRSVWLFKRAACVKPQLTGTSRGSATYSGICRLIESVSRWPSTVITVLQDCYLCVECSGLGLCPFSCTLVHGIRMHPEWTAVLG